MEIDVAKGHEENCEFLQDMDMLLRATGVSEFITIEHIHPYLMVDEHTGSQFLQLKLIFLRKHRVRECEIAQGLDIMSIYHINDFVSRTTFKRCAIPRMKASCSLAFRDTAGDPSPRHKI